MSGKLSKKKSDVGNSSVSKKKSKIEEQTIVCEKCTQKYKNEEQYKLHSCFPISCKVRKALDTIFERENKAFETTSRVLHYVKKWIETNEDIGKIKYKSRELIPSSIKCEKCENGFISENQMKLHTCEPLWTLVETALDEIGREEYENFSSILETVEAAKKWLKSRE